MKIELDTCDMEPLVRRIVAECMRQLKHSLTAELAAPREKGNTAGDENRLLLSAAEAAELLSVSERTLWELKRRGDLPYVAIGSGSKKESIRYALADLLALIEQRRSYATGD